MDDVLFKVINKYTGGSYDVLKFDTVHRKVTLRRSNGSVFEIDMAEYRCYYKVVDK